MVVEICFFNGVCAKKQKKQENLCKNMFLKFSPEHWFYPQKIAGSDNLSFTLTFKVGNRNFTPRPFGRSQQVLNAKNSIFISFYLISLVKALNAQI